MAKKTLTNIEKTALDIWFARLLALASVREEAMFGSGFIFSDQIDYDNSSGAVQLGGQIGGTVESPDIRGIRETLGPTLLTIGNIADGQTLTRSGNTVIGTFGGGAPIEARYVVLQAHAGLTSERVLVGTTGEIDITDGGAGANVTLSLDPSIVRVGGQIGGTGSDPDIRGLRETGGPNLLEISVIDDGQYLKRSGLTVVGASPVELGGQIGGTATDPEILGIRETSGPSLLTIGGIADGQALKRSGASILGFAAVEIGGQLGGTSTSPDVRGIRETSGPSLLAFGAIADGQYLKRSGLTVVSATPVELGGQIGGTTVSPDIRGIRETSGPSLLAFGAIADGQYLKRSGLTVVSATPVELGGQIGGTTTSPDIRGLRESGGILLSYGAIGDGQGLVRSGTNVVGVALLALSSSAPSNVTRAAASAGVGTDAARWDHKHDISVGVPVGIGLANSQGTASSLALSDHVHAHGDLDGGTLHAEATTLVAGFFSAIDKTKLDGIDDGATATPLSSTLPLAVGTASAGVGTSASRDDHIHAHGDQAGGTLHSVASESVAGFMAAADKAQLTAFKVAGEPSGFLNRTDSTISRVDGTRTFTIEPTTVSFDYYYSSTKRTVSAPETIVWPDTDGIHFIYYDQDTLTTSTTPWDLTDADLVPIVAILWDATNNKSFVMEERHGVTMDSATHLYLHTTQGTRLVSGGSVTAGTYALNGTTDADNSFGVDSTVVADEDIRTNIAALTDGNAITRMWREGASGVWRWDTSTVFPKVGTGATYLAWNEYTGGSWGLTDLATDEYVNWWLFAVPTIDGVNQFVLIPGQAKHASLSAAQLETVGSLSWGSVPFTESVALAQITYRTNSGYTTTGKCRIEALASIRGVSLIVSNPSAGITDLGIANRDTNTLDITSSTGADATIPAVTTLLSGLMTGADKTKLDGIATGATNTPLSSTLPLAVGTASAGVGTSASRDDHVHAHGTQAGGTLHSEATTGTAGFMSAADKTKLDSSARAWLMWGNNSVASTTTTRYLTPGWGDTTAPTSAIQFRAPSAGVLRNMYVRHNTGAGNGSNIVYTVRVNGVASALTATLASTATDGNDLVNTVTIAQGDLIDIEVTKAASVVTSPSNIQVTLEVRA